MDEPEDPRLRSDWLINIWAAIRDLERRLNDLEKLVEKNSKRLR